MVRATNPAAKVITARLEAIRDELVAGVNPAYVVRRIWDLIDDIESADSLPPVSGGAPDDSGDYEIIDLDGLADPSWPAYPDLECDGDRWEPNFDGPTPDSVLAESAPLDSSYDAWLSRLDAVRDAASLWAEADQLAAHGCC